MFYLGGEQCFNCFLPRHSRPRTKPHLFLGRLKFPCISLWVGEGFFGGQDYEANVEEQMQARFRDWSCEGFHSKNRRILFLESHRDWKKSDDKLFALERDVWPILLRVLSV